MTAFGLDEFFFRKEYKIKPGEQSMHHTTYTKTHNHCMALYREF